jgi:hypothetical protein
VANPVAGLNAGDHANADTTVSAPSGTSAAILIHVRAYSACYILGDQQSEHDLE